MKLTLEANRLRSLASRVLKFAGRGPIFGFVHLEAGFGFMRVSASNERSGIRIVARDIQAVEPGSWTMASDQLEKFSVILPANRTLDLSIRGSTMHVDAGISVDVPIFTVDDTADMPVPPPDITWRRAWNMTKAIDHCLWAVERGTPVPQFEGLHMTPEHCQATNGQVLAHAAVGLVDENIIVPAATLRAVGALQPSDDVRLAVEDGRRLWMRDDDWAVYLTLIGGPYPNTTGMIFKPLDGVHTAPGNKKTAIYSININRHQALDVVTRIVSSMVQSDRLMGVGVAFDYDERGLHFRSHYPEGEARRSIVVDSVVDWEPDIGDEDGFLRLHGRGLKAESMRQALDSLSSSVVKMMWAHEPGYPFQFHDPDAGLVSLVMPRRL